MSTKHARQFEERKAAVRLIAERISSDEEAPLVTLPLLNALYDTLLNGWNICYTSLGGLYSDTKD